MRITKQEAEGFLRLDVKDSEAAVKNLVTVPLTQNQFDSLVSFVFNLGQGAFAKSTLLRKLNSGDYSAVPAQLMRSILDITIDMFLSDQ